MQGFIPTAMASMAVARSPVQGIVGRSRDCVMEASRHAGRLGQQKNYVLGVPLSFVQAGTSDINLWDPVSPLAGCIVFHSTDWLMRTLLNLTIGY
jgi:hypothetical protein